MNYRARCCDELCCVVLLLLLCVFIAYPVALSPLYLQPPSDGAKMCVDGVLGAEIVIGVWMLLLLSIIMLQILSAVLLYSL